MKEFAKYLHIDFYGLFCTCVHALTMMLIWNWHATKHLGFVHIGYPGAFIIVFFIRRLFSLRFSIETATLKDLLHQIQPHDDKKIRNAENTRLLAECYTMIVIAYILRFVF